MNACVCGTLTAMAMTALAAAETPRPAAVDLVVEAGPHPRRITPLVVTLPGSFRGIRFVTLTQSSPSRTVAAQVLTGDPPRLAWMLDDLPAGATRAYRVEAASDAGSVAGVVACDSDGKVIRLAIGDRPVLQYNAAVVESPAGIEPYYRRSGQIHPLFTPAGQVVSDDFPPDHAHQHGLFFAWVNTTFEGRHLDFWNQKELTGRIAHAATLETVSGPVCGEFRVRLRHDDVTTPDRPRPVLDEVWTLRAYNVRDIFLVDFESRQECAGESPLRINEYHYGGMGLRARREWFDPSVKGGNPPDPSKSGRSDFLTSEGQGRASGNHSRPDWVDISGEVGVPSGGIHRGGVTLFDHPENFRFPQSVRLHPNKPYFCFSPMVQGPFEIVAGRPYVSRYRLAIHDGPPDASLLGRLWRDYAEPPIVKLDAGR
jgi:hypothetical protein